MSRLLHCILGLAILLVPYQVSFAVETDLHTAASKTNIFCTDNFSLDNIEFTVSGNQTEAAPQTSIISTGVVKNQNQITVPATELRASVYQVTDGETLHLVDRYVVAENIVLPESSEYTFTDEWIVPRNQSAGEYVIEYALVFMGNEAALEGYGPRFTVVSEEQSVEFLYDTLRINGEPYFTFDQTTLGDDDTVTLSIQVVNPTAEQKMIPLQWNQYFGDYQIETNRLDTKTSVLTIAANSQETISYTTRPTSAKQFTVNALLDDGGTKSLFDFQFLRAPEDPSILVAGISSVPLSADQSTDIFYCVSATAGADLTSYRLLLEVTDQAGTVLTSITRSNITDVLVPNFVSANNQNYAVVRATLEKEGVPITQTTLAFDCNALGVPCINESFSENTIMNLLLNPLFIISTIVIILLLCWVVRNHIKKSGTKIDRNIVVVAPVFFIGLVAFGLLFTNKTVDASTVTWDATLPSPGFYITSLPGQIDLDVSVSYGVTVRNMSAGNSIVTNGSTVSVGDQLQVTIDPFQNSDIVWRSGNTDSFFWKIWRPGVPRNGYVGRFSQAPSGVCTSDNVLVISVPWCPGPIGWFGYGDGGISGYVINTGVGCPNSAMFAHTVWVDTPGTSITGNGLSCSGNTCTVTGSGPIDLSVNFQSTDLGIHYLQSEAGQSPMVCTEPTAWPTSPVIHTVPQQTINFSLNSSSAAPSCSAGAIGFDATTLQEFLDRSQECVNLGYVLESEDGDAETGSPGNANAGPGTCLVIFDDANPGWRGRLYRFPGCVAPVVDLKINNSDGPVTVPDTAALNIGWNSTGVSSCTLYGAGLPGGGVTLTGSRTVPASAITSSPETYILNCDGVTDSVVVNVTASNAPPNPPTIVGPVNGDTSTSYPFTFTATDPNGDQIQYDVDWNNDGTSEVTSLLVNSGVGIVGNRSWPAPGTYTFQVRARDVAGLVSGWTQHTITLALSGPTTANLEASINGGGWNSTDQTVNSSDTVALRWNSTNASSCTGSGSGFNTANNTTGSDNVDTPSNNTSIVFTVTCTGPGGTGADSLTITTRQLPNFSQPNITYTLGAFNPSTGAYDSINFIFQTTNNGGSDTSTNANYSLEFDRGQNGYDHTANGSLGTLTVGQSVSRTEVVTGSIPLGNNRVRVTVDSTNAVSETDETDNVRILDLNVGSPDPGLSITANPARVQNNQNSTISWTVGNPYPLNCSVFGPAMTTRNFNPVTNGPSGNASAGPITAKSEYTLRCVEPNSGTVFTRTATVEAQGVIEEI